MELYKKPVMNVIEMEDADVLTQSCDGCATSGWNGISHDYDDDGCAFPCTHHPHVGEE